MHSAVQVSKTSCTCCISHACASLQYTCATLQAQPLSDDKHPHSGVRVALFSNLMALRTLDHPASKHTGRRFTSNALHTRASPKHKHEHNKWKTHSKFGSACKVAISRKGNTHDKAAQRRYYNSLEPQAKPRSTAVVHMHAGDSAWDLGHTRHMDRRLTQFISQHRTIQTVCARSGCA